MAIHKHSGEFYMLTGSPRLLALPCDDQGDDRNDGVDVLHKTKKLLQVVVQCVWGLYSRAAQADNTFGKYYACWGPAA